MWFKITIFIHSLLGYGHLGFFMITRSFHWVLCQTILYLRGNLNSVHKNHEYIQEITKNVWEFVVKTEVLTIAHESLFTLYFITFM